MYLLTYLRICSLDIRSVNA